ncbi:sigma-70 family RNA polymerase sigma factor [Algoriphagus sp. H41]|uniref:Sigma-70 family RNA polymerase sigma factor n=1 Tax=Algoriphagus oliviformis TaxID=2811231 RepID=A0ABS3C2D5_9BACT|nr:sigma-70 family RNA polymerase sigma factor [Algoriphagus oliviformis]MBN7811113.1 sigma-70 family RNA polymerase sigma factor [Algoriphagus oliviformis]
MNPKLQVAEEESAYWLRLKDGDQSALRFFYELYVDELFGFGMTLTGSESQVKDAVQDVFLELWRYHSSVNSSVNVKFYLYKCLANRIFREGRESKKSEAVHQKYMEEHGAIVESAESKLANFQVEAHLKVKLSEAIEDLPKRQKAVIDCLYFQDFSYEETSQIMNINLRSTYTLAWKAVSNLKKHLLKVVNLLVFWVFVG